MKHKEGFFTGVRGAGIYYQCWLPEDKPRAVLIIVHGLAEHSGRYMNVVDHFVPLGYAVYGIDYLGHGRSDGTRVYVEKFDDYIDTLSVYVDMVRKWQPNKPSFLLGHSMGALVSAIFLLDHQAELSGAILSGPSVKVPSNTSAITISMVKLLSILLPKIGVLQLEAAGVSRDPAVVQAYVSDPLVHTRKTTARLTHEILKAMQRITAEASKITLPVLIVQGSADRLVDPDSARMLHDTVGSVDKRIKIYDGFYHEVFNEPEHDRVLGDVEAWLESRV
jgi:alpha-beta hydrolase superfamily lysophospholipase